MQSALTSHYELAWEVAELVSAHGSYDFRAGEEGLRQTVRFCGLRVSFLHKMPVRIEASNLDVALTARPGTQSFETTFEGDVYRRAHALVGAEYHLTFAQGDIAVLRGWHDQILAFVSATASRKAA